MPRRSATPQPALWVLAFVSVVAGCLPVTRDGPLRFSCVADADCATGEGYVCRANICVEDTGGVRIDGGPREGGAGDAGDGDGDGDSDRDAGIDGGVPDAGFPDPIWPQQTRDPVVLYTFFAGTGVVVRDLSARTPPMHLVVEDPAGMRWEPDGLMFIGGGTALRAVQSAKLTDALIASEAFSVEVWMTPASASAEGPARLVTLSAGTNQRNLSVLHGGTSGVSASQYRLRLRTTTTDGDGQPPAATADGIAQAALTHLVFTFSRTDGVIRAYVNGAQTVLTDATRVGGFSTWDESFAFALADEFSADRAFLGTLHLVAVYDRALLAADVMALHAAGPPCIDRDGDGYGRGCALGSDCDDRDPSLHEGQPIYADLDGDGWTRAMSATACLGRPLAPGHVPQASDTPDCDDNDSDVNPAGGEVCDGRDNDCDGSVDEDACACPAFYADGFVTHPYLLCESQKSWSAAQADCQAQGPYRLARPNFEVESDFLANLLDSDAWIDLKEQGGVWAWSDGSPLRYTHWGDGEPNGPLPDNCGRARGDGFWADRDCTENYDYVCEVDDAASLGPALAAPVVP